MPRARLKSPATIPIRCATRATTAMCMPTLLDWSGGPITLKALKAGGATLGKVSKVELLGSERADDICRTIKG